MSKGTKTFWAAVMIVVVVAVVYALQQKGKTPGAPATGAATLSGPVKIGGMIPLTGEGAAYGTPIQRAGLLALEEINAAGGIGGQKVEVVWEDSKCDSREGASAAQRLVNVSGVKYIFGGVCSSETLAASPITEPAKVLVISPSATSPDVTTAGDFVFRLSPSDAFAGRIGAEYAYNKMYGKKAAVISETKDYTQGLRKVFTERFKELGGEIVADETYNTGSTDFRTQILKVKQANPDVVYVVPQAPASGILILKQMAEQKVGAKLLTAEVLVGRDVVKENAKLMEGLIGIEPYFDETAPKSAAFVSAYKAKYNEELAFPAFQANMYAQFYLLKEAIEKVGDSTEKVRDFLYGVKDWEYAGGKLTFDKNGDPLAEYSVKQAQNGEVKEIEVVKPQ